MSILFFLWLFFPFFSAQAVTVAPLRQTVTIDPGSEQVARLEVKNDSDKERVFVPAIDAFTIDPATGRPMFGQSDEATRWIKTQPASLRLGRGEAGIFLFIIAVPRGAQPGGHYLGLFAGESPGDGQIGLGARAGTLLFLTVAGTVREELLLQDFSLAKTVAMDPVERVFLQVANVGTVHVAPQGDLVVQNILGDEVERLPLNPTERKVLPDGKWSASYELKRLSWTDAGRLQAVLDLKYGVTHQRIVGRAVFWYLPWQFIAVVGVLIILMIAGMMIKIKKS